MGARGVRRGPAPATLNAVEPGDIAFPGLVGHERVCGLLTRAIQRGRLHHGLMIVGNRGVGKSTLARGLGCALLCETRPGVGCGQCVPCRRVLGDHHTDVVRLEPKKGQKSSTIDTESAKRIANSIHQAPYESAAHLVIVRPADQLHLNAANALLKSIEEPPPGVHFALLTSNVRAVLPTIQSRCIELRLAPLPDAQVAEVLDRDLARRGIEVDPNRRRVAIELAQGSPGVAIELAIDEGLDQLRAVLAAAVRAADEGPPAIFAGDRSRLWSAWSDAVRAQPWDDGEEDEEEEVVVVVKGKKKTARKKKAKKPKDSELNSPARQRQAAIRLTDLWLLHLRERLRGREGLAGVPANRRESSAALAHSIQIVQTLQDSIQKNPNVRLALEQALLELSA